MILTRAIGWLIGWGGRTLLSRRTVAIAGPVLETALRLAPDDDETRLDCALALLWRGRYGDARECLAPLVEAPTDGRAWPLLGSALENEERHREAADAYGRAAGHGDRRASTYLAWAGNLMALDLPAEAAEVYASGLEHAPDNAELWAWRGHALAQLSRWRDAIESLQRSLELSAHPDPCWPIALAGCLIQVVRLDEAAAQLDRAASLVELSSFDATNVHMLRADLAVRRNQPDRALALVDAVLRREPEAADVVAYRSHVLLMLEQPEDAMAAAERAVSLDGRHPAAHGALGDVHLARGAAADALASYELALDLHGGAVATVDRPPPDQVRMYLTAARASALSALDRHAEARRDFERLLMVDKDYLARNPDVAPYYQAVVGTSGQVDADAPSAEPKV